MKENYEIIKGYLETLPASMTIEDAVNNIKKAESMKMDSLQKIEDELKKRIGTCYYYDDLTDDVVFVKYFTKITGTKRLPNRDTVLLTATVLEVSEDTIYYMDNVTFCEGDLKDCDIVDGSVIDEAYKRYFSLFKYNPKEA